MKASSKKEFYFKVFAVFFGVFFIFFTIVSIEIFLRITEKVEISDDMSHPILNHVWRPNFSWTDAEGNKGHYNNHGWKEWEDVTPDKPQNEFRIFYVGDSNTEGPLPMDAPVSEQVEKKLSPYFAQKGFDLNVINSGTSSYSLMIYYLLIKTSLLELKPDLVVINMDMTDVFDDYLYMDTAQYDENGDLIACPPGHRLKGRYVRTEDGMIELSLFGRVYNWVKTHLRLYTVIKPYLVKIVDAIQNSELKGVSFDEGGAHAQKDAISPEKKQPGLRDWCESEWDERTSELVAHSMLYLKKSIQVLALYDIPTVITGVPHRAHFAPREDGSFYSELPFEAIRKACEEAGGYYLDSYHPLRSLLGENPGEYYRESIHFTPAGYELWAQVQANFLLEWFERYSYLEDISKDKIS